MRSLGDIIADNARAEGHIALAFMVYVVIDPTAVADSVPHADRTLAEAVVENEITSNLESVPYVVSVNVRRRTI